MMNKKGGVELGTSRLALTIIKIVAVLILIALAYTMITGKGAELLSIFD